jgi:hypothetical protein
MGRETRTTTFIQSVLKKLPRRKLPEADEPAMTPLVVLEELHAGGHRDYCLYLRPAMPQAWDGGRPSEPLSTGLESLLARAFDPLPVLAIEEMSGEAASFLPDEAFLTLAESSRVLLLVPSDHPQFIDRLRLLKESSAIVRAILLMPDQKTLGPTDWPAAWHAARAAAAQLGIELSPYTGGGWLFRIATDGKACTFRPIANPNHEKIARALEAICGEMT